MMGRSFLLFSLVMTMTPSMNADAAGPGQAAEFKSMPSDVQAAPGGSVKNNVFFATGEAGNQHMQQMKERLTDPEQRAAFRAEQRANIQEHNAEAVRALALAPETEQKFIELLTDQQMDRFDQMYVMTPRDLDTHQQARRATEQLAAQRKLIGEDKFDLFQNYTLTATERRQIDLIFGPRNDLQPEQRERLIALLKEDNARRIETMRPMRMPTFLPRMPSPEETQRQSQLSTITANEDTWRRRRISNPELEKQAGEFLSTAQLATFSKYLAREQDRLQQWLEAARVDAGLDAKIPEVAVLNEVADTPIDGEVEVDIHMIVNRGEPAAVKKKVRSGQSFTFEAGDGLIAQVTPTLYSDDFLYVHLSYYERGATGKHALSGGSVTPVRTRSSDGSLMPPSRSIMAVTGRKGYAVETTIAAVVL